MKRLSLVLFCLCFPLFSQASECALSVDEGLAAILAQDGALESVTCEKNVIADLDITVIFRCSDGAESPLIAAVDRSQGESWCAVNWYDCSGLGSGYQTPVPVSGKSAAEDFAAIRNACSDLL